MSREKRREARLGIAREFILGLENVRKVCISKLYHIHIKESGKTRHDIS